MPNYLPVLFNLSDPEAGFTCLILQVNSGKALYFVQRYIAKSRGKATVWTFINPSTPKACVLVRIKRAWWGYRGLWKPFTGWPGMTKWIIKESLASHMVQWVVSHVYRAQLKKLYKTKQNSVWGTGSLSRQWGIAGPRYRREEKPRELSLAFGVAYSVEIPVASKRSSWRWAAFSQVDGHREVKGSQAARAGDECWSNPRLVIASAKGRPWKWGKLEIHEPSQELQPGLKSFKALGGFWWSNIANASSLTSFQKQKWTLSGEKFSLEAFMYDF